MSSFIRLGTNVWARKGRIVAVERFIYPNLSGNREGGYNIFVDGVTKPIWINRKDPLYPVVRKFLDPNTESICNLPQNSQN